MDVEYWEFGLKPNQEPNTKIGYIHLLSHISPNKAKYSHWTVTWTKICCYCFFSLNSELIQTETNVVYFLKWLNPN